MRRPQRWLFHPAALAAVALLGSARPAAADPAAELDSVIAAVRAAVADGRTTPSKVLGFDMNRKGDFTETPSEPGVLTGFDLGLGKFFDVEIIYAYRAVFMTAHGDEALSEHGLFRDKVGPKNKRLKTKVLHVVHVRARPGYAVGGLTLRSGLDINGLSVTFMRMKDGKLDPQDSYESDWVGDRTGGGEANLTGGGAPVIGIAGNQDDEHASALGLTFTTEPAPVVVPPVAAPPVVRPLVVAQPAPPPPPAPLRIENPPAPAAAPPLAEPPVPQQQPPAEPAREPAAVPARPAAAPPVAEKSPLDTLLTYGVPAAAFVAVVGLVLVFALTSMNRKSQPVRRPANRPNQPVRRPPAVVAPPPLAALRERPAPWPPTADDVLELTLEDCDPDPPQPQGQAQTPKPSSPDSWPPLEL